MKLNERIKEVVEFAKTVDPDNDYLVEKNWAKEVEILSENIPATIAYIENECDDESIYWLSESFEELMDATQNRELLKVLEERAKKIVDDEMRRSTLVEIDYAECHILD